MPKTDTDSIVHKLWGGLTLTPYGLALLLSAYAFARGWLDWETNGGPPFLGLLTAYGLDRLLRYYYHKKYNFSFHKPAPYSTPKFHSPFRKGLGFLLILGLLGAGLVDMNLELPIRLLPLCLGGALGWRGLDWIQQQWLGYGALHVGLGVSLIGLSIGPMLLKIPPNTLYFGLEGVFELTLLGIADIAIGIMEHQIFVATRAVGFE